MVPAPGSLGGKDSCCGAICDAVSGGDPNEPTRLDHVRAKATTSLRQISPMLLARADEVIEGAAAATLLPARPPAPERRLPLLCLFPRLQKRLRRLSLPPSPPS
jgi:hypothetical protein